MKRVGATIHACLAALVFATLVAATTAPAFAQSQASVLLGGLDYELHDLDASDGVAPWISFQDIWNIGGSADVALADGALSDGFETPGTGDPARSIACTPITPPLPRPGRRCPRYPPSLTMA